MMTIMFITVIINFDNSHSKLLPLHHTLPLHHDDTMFIIKIITVIIIFKIDNDNMDQPPLIMTKFSPTEIFQVSTQIKITKDIQASLNIFAAAQI